MLRHWSQLVPNKNYVSRHPRTLSNTWRKKKKRKNCCHRVQELCESRGGRPGLPVLMSLMVSVDVKQHGTMLRHWSQFVPNRSADIRGHEALRHHHHCCDEMSLSWSQWHELVTFRLSQKQRGAVQSGLKFVCLSVIHAWQPPFPLNVIKWYLTQFTCFGQST